MGVDDLLTKYPKLLVVRSVEGQPEDFYMQTQGGDIEMSDTIFKNSMANLSLNLAGGLFDTGCKAHLRFLPAIKEASVLWDGKDVPVELYSSDDCYHFYDTCFGLCFFVSDIHNKTFPFYRHFDSQCDRDQYEMDTIAAVSKEEMIYDAHFVGEFKNRKENILVKPRLKVHHMPSKVNYWHMTLDTYRPTDTDFIQPQDKQNSADKSMFKALKQNLLQCCHINITPEYSIASCDYTLV